MGGKQSKNNTGLKNKGKKDLFQSFSKPKIQCKTCKPCCPQKNSNIIYYVILFILIIIIVIIIPIFSKMKVLKWYNDYNNYWTQKTFSPVLYIYFFESNLLYRLFSIFQPIPQQLNTPSMYYLSELIEINGCDNTLGWVTPYHITTSLVPYNTNGAQVVTDAKDPCRWTWNWAAYNNDYNINNMTDKNVKYQSILRLISKKDSPLKQIINKKSNWDTNKGLASTLDFATRIMTASEQTEIKENINFDANENLNLLSDWRLLIQLWGSFWVKNDDNLYMLGVDPTFQVNAILTEGIPSPYGGVKKDSNMTDMKIGDKAVTLTPSQCRSMWWAEKPFDTPFYQSNFLAQVWGIPPDSPLIEAFVTGASISGSGQKLYPDLLARLLGIKDGLISNGWIGFLNELNPKSYAEIKTVIYGEDVNIQGSNTLLKSNADSGGAGKPSCKKLNAQNTQSIVSTVAAAGMLGAMMGGPFGAGVGLISALVAASAGGGIVALTQNHDCVKS